MEAKIAHLAELGHCLGRISAHGGSGANIGSVARGSVGLASSSVSAHRAQASQ
jgi:hypothetical protein